MRNDKKWSVIPAYAGIQSQECRALYSRFRVKHGMAKGNSVELRWILNDIAWQVPRQPEISLPCGSTIVYGNWENLVTELKTSNHKRNRKRDNFFFEKISNWIQKRSFWIETSDKSRCVLNIQSKIIKIFYCTRL